MARKSSLESRLSAVLSSKLNRRRVSLVAAALALVIAVGFSVPLAMLRAMEEKAPAEIKSGTTMRKPKHEYAQALWQTWQAQARTDGKIPGALVGQLAGEIDSFLKQHPEDELAPKLAALKKRIDATRDWAQDDVVTLLDDITAISTAPVSWVHLPLEFDEMRNVKRGIPLPDGLKSADWGDAAANGLRTAWLLEPRAEKYPLGSVFKARVLFHNTGKAPIVISIETWRQHDGHTAKNAKDETINVSGTHYTGITPMTSYRLSPGEYCEVLGHGIAIGAGKYEEEFSTGAVGAIIEAKEGDDVRLTHRVSTADGGWTRPDDPKDPNELWKKAVAERVAREAPLPTSAADREQLIRRVTLDVFGEGPSAEEVAAFVANKEADALAKLTAKLQAKPRPVPFTGELFTGETKFRVTATDPDADKKPRTANAPGRYILGENVHLLVSQTTTDSGWTNKATIAFLSPDPKVASPHKPYEIALPDGLLTWGAAWERGKGELWILQKGLARKYDFTDPDAVKETRYDEGGMKNVPAVLHEAFTKIFSVPGAPVQKQQELKPKEGALLEPAIEKRLKWGGPVNGLRGAIVIREAAEPKGDNKLELLLVVQNVSKEPIRLIDTVSAAKIRDLSVKVAGITQAVIVDKEPTMTDVNLAPQAVAYLPLMRGESITGRPAGAVVAEGALKNAQQTLVAGLQIEAPPAGAWKGKLVTGETTGVIAAGEPQPKNEHARDLLELLNKQARLNGDIPGGLIDLLGKKVLEFVRNNTGDTGGDSYAKKMAPLVARFGAVRDWPRAEVVKLLDEVAAAHAIPLQTTSEHLWLHSLRTGTPLPKELATEPWGATDASGLRLAWQLEPKATEHRLGTPLHANILIHNAGKLPVVFRTENWHQFSNHQARDAKGAEIKIESTYWTTLAHLVTYRLAPGEYIELKAAGIGVGAHGKDDEQWQGTRVGSWIEAKAGDEVTFQAAAVPFGDWDEEKGVAGNPDWWLKFVTERLSREQPLPADSQERIRLLDRVVRDLFGVPPTAQEVAAFVADNKPAAFESLAKRLATRSGQNTFRGSLKSGPTKFRVIPVDPDAAKKPRTASNPGRYTLGDNVRLEVSRRPDGTRIVNEATIHFYSADQKSDPPGKPVELKVSDGYNSWAAAWVPRGTVLWVKDTNGLRSYDINDPAKVKVQAIDEPAKTDQVPQAIKEALNAALMPPPK
jgi:hypothetical protein